MRFKSTTLLLILPVVLVATAILSITSYYSAKVLIENQIDNSMK
ncbi:hypothetical protein [Clostridium zeae]|nr:hypothetical protein [Clostridium zeae]